MPKEVLDAVERIVAVGKEAIVKKERGKWVVLVTMYNSYSLLSSSKTS